MTAKKCIITLLSCFAFACMAGCIRLSFTPVVSNPQQLVPSELAKSVLIGESCGSVNAFGSAGDLSLGQMLKQKKITKVTFVDYSLSLSILGGDVCMKVYGY